MTPGSHSGDAAGRKLPPTCSTPGSTQFKTAGDDRSLTHQRAAVALVVRAAAALQLIKDAWAQWKYERAMMRMFRAGQFSRKWRMDQ